MLHAQCSVPLSNLVPCACCGIIEDVYLLVVDAIYWVSQCHKIILHELACIGACYADERVSFEQSSSQWASTDGAIPGAARS